MGPLTLTPLAPLASGCQPPFFPNTAAPTGQPSGNPAAARPWHSTLSLLSFSLFLPPSACHTCSVATSLSSPHPPIVPTRSLSGRPGGRVALCWPPRCPVNCRSFLFVPLKHPLPEGKETEVVGGRCRRHRALKQAARRRRRSDVVYFSLRMRVPLKCCPDAPPVCVPSFAMAFPETQRGAAAQGRRRGGGVRRHVLSLHEARLHLRPRHTHRRHRARPG